MSKKKYEALVIFSAAVRDDGLEAAVGRFADELKALGAEIESTEALGRRTFARTLAKRDAGLYAKVRFDAEPDAFRAADFFAPFASFAVFPAFAVFSAFV